VTAALPLASMPSRSVHLLKIEPDVGRLLSPDEREAAADLTLPTLSVGRNAHDILEQIEGAGAFGAFVLEGMLLDQIRLGDQLGIRLLGPSDLIWLRSTPPPMIVSELACRAAAPTRLALLGDELLSAANRWPQLIAGLQLRLACQSDRLAAQLVICQLPRVDQRLMAMMWLLAESWGRVTAAGTTLPLALTHDALGGMVGARRPTVTLALGELTDRGAVVRLDQGWLLIEEPPQRSAWAETIHAPALLDQPVSEWSSTADRGANAERDRAELESSYVALREAVSALREQHARNTDRFQERLTQMATTRKRCAASRERLAQERISRQRSPSS